MLRFIAKRLLLLMPILGVSAVLAFLITTCNTSDVVSARVAAQNGEEAQGYNKQFADAYKAMHFDEPVFYFGVHSAILPDTLYKIADDKQRDVITTLCFRYHDKDKVMQWMRVLHAEQLYAIAHAKTDTTNRAAWAQRESITEQLLTIKNLHDALPLIQQANDATINKSYTTQLDTLAHSLINNAPHTFIQTFIPHFVWHGTACRFHRWVKDICAGTFGVSLSDNNPVIDKIKEAWPVTIVIGFIAMLLLFIIGITAGITHSLYKHSVAGRFIQPLFFLLHAIPNYTLATWSIILFCCGGFLCWLPTGGIGDDSLNTLQRIPYIILPVMCWIAPLLSIIAAHTSAAHTDAMQSEYVLAAKAKGLSNRRLLRHTILPALVPVVALSGILIPALLSGSVIIENIFSIPGIGKLQYEALLARDIPVVLAITLFTVVLSVTAQLISDIILYLIDPRTRHTS